ncbi:hypothetical protein D6851_15610 [Altericroceibacterium spongiae]|uniref:Uncharacterized protein n=1 Tax=Altericroceibacterium spongiae TaxID=2320269 RepID=A0A420EAH6_9SPHN|nr:hypothetical protein [Altericroceibacterium spongiae]RKF17686.1 hypothetical protein D6851_15610 [Altericroceibacterium spongiae]
MYPLRSAIDLHGKLIDRDTRRARLLAARRRPVGGINRKGILSGHWDAGDVVGAFRNGKGSFVQNGPPTFPPGAE